MYVKIKAEQGLIVDIFAPIYESPPMPTLNFVL